jgi:aryl-alcohol dehydrogenase-like predicted oxidoreductase
MTNPLPTAILGRTGLKVTRLGFGTALYNTRRPGMTPEHWKGLLNVVVDSGINFIDTAYDYVNAEVSIGQFLSGRHPQFHLATKCGCTESDGTQNTSDHVWTRDNLFRTLEDSLRRLKRDTIDVMQLHNPTVKQCEEGRLVAALEEMRRGGAVRWIGMSSGLPDLPTYIDWGVFDTFQIPYSALERQHETWITRAAEAGAGIIIRGGVAQGEPGIGLGAEERWERFEKAGLDDLRDRDETRSAFVIRFTLTHRHTHTIIVGTRNLDHVRENVQAVQQGPLSQDVYEEAKRRLDAVGDAPVE